MSIGLIGQSLMIQYYMPTEIYSPVVIKVSDGFNELQGQFLPPIVEDVPLVQQLDDHIATGVLVNRMTLRNIASIEIADPQWEKGDLLCMTEVLDEDASRVSIFRKTEGSESELFGVSPEGLPVLIADKDMPMITLLPQDQKSFALVARKKGEKDPRLFLYVKQTPSSPED